MRLLIMDQQIILAFVLTAYITFIIVLIGYFLGCVPEDSLGIVDHRVIRIKKRVSPAWTHVLERVILMFSDQQILTGIAILATGFIKYCTISVYHYQIVLYLAWMSSGTHLVTLTVLRNYLRDNAVLRTWRIIGMSIIFILLTVALFPTTAGNWGELAMGWDLGLEIGYGGQNPTGSAIIAAQCFWEPSNWGSSNSGGGWNSYSLVSYIFLLSSYIARASALFAQGEEFFRKWLRQKPGYLVKRGLDRLDLLAASRPKRFRWVWRAPHTGLLAVFTLALATYDLYASFIASMLYLFLVLFFGSWQIFVPRAFIPSQMLEAENSFGFGQIIPLLLLTLPLLTLLEIYRGTSLLSI